MTESARPFIVVTAVIDASARAASITRCHGQAMERAFKATAGQATAGLDLVELPIDATSHALLRSHLALSDTQVGVYDLFPLAPHLTPDVRRAAGQFLAAEALWALDAQSVFPGSLAIKLELPDAWAKDPKQVHERLVAAGALDLSEAAIATFIAAKIAWAAAA